MRTKKRLLSLLLCGAMLFSLCSPSAFAEAQTIQDSGQITVNAGGLCEHHTEHTPDCGYTEGEPEIPCIHEHVEDCYTEVTECVHKHTADCYPEETESSVSGNNAAPSNAEEREPENCGHVCSEENGCIRKELNCLHKHDQSCDASSAAEGIPCSYICKVCKASDSSLEGSSLEGSSEENSSIGNSGIETSDTETTDTEKGNQETSNPELQKPVNIADELEVQTAPDLEKSSAAAATLIIGNVSTVETNPDLLGDGGSASYDADTHTLTLNACRLPDGKIIFMDYQDETLTIELNGRNVIPYINVSSDGLSLRITGNGSLEIENKDTHAIISNNGDIEISGGATITAISSTDCGIFALGSIKISDSTVTAKGNGEGLRGDAGIVINDGSKVETGSTGKCALYTHLGNVEISGGASVIAFSTANETNGIYTPEGKITISSSEVTADSYYPGLVGTQGVIIADGSDVTSVSSHDAAIYTPSTITISASKVNANGYYPSLFGNQGVAIADGSDVTAVSSNDCAIFSRAAVTISASKVNAEGYGVGLRGNGGVSIEDGSKVTTTATASSGKAPSGIYSENDFVLNNSELYTESEHLGIFTQNKGTISGAWLQANNGIWAENKDQYTIADSVIIESGKGQVNGDARLFQGANLRTGDEIDISQGTSLTVEAGGIKILGGSGSVTVGSNGELLLPPGTVLQKTDGAEGMEQMIGNGGGSIRPDGRVEDWSSYKLTLSVPAFEDAEYGYTPKAKAITITNIGDSNAIISDITISGSAFTLNSGDKLVYTDCPNNTWTIQPEAGLNAGTYTGTLTVTYNGNATVTAEVKFTVNPLPAKYTVAVQTNGNGTASASPASAAQGEKITLTASANSGYHFKEWQVVPGSVIISGNIFTMPAGEVTVKAIFEKDTYTVNLIPNGGTINSGNVTEYTYGVGAALPTADNMTYADHTFLGWYDNRSLTGDAVTEISRDDTGNKVFYAKWLSASVGVTRVSVEETPGNIDGTDNAIFNVTLPFGMTLPTDSSQISIILADKNAAFSTPSPADNGATWTFTVTAEDGRTKKDYTIKVSVAPNPAAGNEADIAAAKSTIQSKSWAVEQSAANTEAEVMSWIENRLDTMAKDLNGVACTVSMTGFTAAAAGSSTNENGTNGSFTFTVSLSKGEGLTHAQDTTANINGTVTATPYQAKSYTVSVTASPTEGGRVSGGGTYTENAPVTVKASPNSGYKFVKWTEGGTEVSKDTSYNFAITGSRTLVAVFEKDGGTTPPQPAEYIVTVQNDGNGTASASPASAAQGEEITLTASANSGYHFKEWQVVSGSVTISGNSFTMPAENVTVKAIFEKDRGGSSEEGSPSTPTYGSNTLSDNGITLSGSEIHKDARLTVTPDKLHDGQCAECDRIRQWQEQGRVIAVYDVSLSQGFRGTVTLTFPVSSAYNGKTLTVAHCLKDKLDICDVAVSDGKVTVTADGLSPFAILDNSEDEPGEDNPDTGTENPGTGTGTTWTNQTDQKSPQTGDNSTAGTADRNATDMADVSCSQKLTANAASLLTGSSGGISPWEIAGLCALPAALLMGTAAAIIKRRRKMKAGTPA